MSQKIVILGGGPAGYEAALVAGELGADVTIVADEGLGGNCVLWDCVPSKALIVAAEAMGWVHTADDLGVRIPGVDRVDRSVVDFPAVSKGVLELGSNQSRDIEGRVEAAGVTILRGRGRITGSHEVTVRREDGNDEVLVADYLLVATGSSARVLPFFQPDGERVLISPQVYDLAEVPERLIVVGSGATGAEFANAFVRFGSDVQLVSSRDLILPTEDPDAAQVIEDVFERRGMTILRNARAVSCERTETGVAVGLKDGSTVQGSHVLFTVGQVPTSRDIGLETVGVEINEWGGIDVDTVGRTNVPWVYAAGDVVGRMMLANVAAMQGRTAMWHALGQAVQPIRWDAVAATIFTDPEVATVGLSQEDCADAGVQVETAKLDFRSQLARQDDPRHRRVREGPRDGRLRDGARWRGRLAPRQRPHPAARGRGAEPDDGEPARPDDDGLPVDGRLGRRGLPHADEQLTPPPTNFAPTNFNILKFDPSKFGPGAEAAEGPWSGRSPALPSRRTDRGGASDRDAVARRPDRDAAPAPAAFEDGDREVVLRMLTCPQTRAYLGGALSRREAESRLRDRALGEAWGNFAICEQPVGLVVGSVTLSHDRDPLEVSWQLLPEHRGLGYAAEAAEAAIAWAFATLEVDEVVAVTQVANTASARLAQRLGMRQTKVLREFGELQLEFRLPRLDREPARV